MPDHTYQHRGHLQSHTPGNLTGAKQYKAFPVGGGSRGRASLYHVRPTGGLDHTTKQRFGLQQQPSQQQHQQPKPTSRQQLPHHEPPRKRRKGHAHAHNFNSTCDNSNNGNPTTTGSQGKADYLIHFQCTTIVKGSKQYNCPTEPSTTTLQDVPDILLQDIGGIYAIQAYLYLIVRRRPEFKTYWHLGRLQRVHLDEVWHHTEDNGKAWLPINLARPSANPPTFFQSRGAGRTTTIWASVTIVLGEKEDLPRVFEGTKFTSYRFQLP